LLLVLAAITYGSRAAALTFLPEPSERVRVLIDRVPPALFAGLAAQAIFDSTGAMAGVPVLAATAGAIICAPFRSLALCLAGGGAGYLLALVLLG
jgi:hypothetical protein